MNDTFDDRAAKIGRAYFKIREASMSACDREIHVQVFGDDPEQSMKKIGRIPRYCQLIALAWLVVEEMERRHKLDFSLDKAFHTGWVATFTNEPTSAKLRMHGDGRAATAAEAVCRAALEALKDD